MGEKEQVNAADDYMDTGLDDAAPSTADSPGPLRRITELISAAEEFGIQRTNVYNYVKRLETKMGRDPIRIDGNVFINQDLYDEAIEHFKKTAARRRQKEEESPTAESKADVSAENQTPAKASEDADRAYQTYVNAMHSAHERLEELETTLEERNNDLIQQGNHIDYLKSRIAELSQSNGMLKSELEVRQNELVQAVRESAAAQIQSRSLEALYNDKSAAYDDLKKSKDQMIDELKQDKAQKDTIIDRLLFNEALREMNLGRLPLESLSNVTEKLTLNEKNYDSKIIDAYIVERKQKVKDQIQEDLEEAGLMEQIREQGSRDTGKEAKPMTADRTKQEKSSNEPARKQGLLARIGYKLISMSKK